MERDTPGAPGAAGSAAGERRSGSASSSSSNLQSGSLSAALLRRTLLSHRQPWPLAVRESSSHSSSHSSLQSSTRGSLQNIPNIASPTTSRRDSGCCSSPPPPGSPLCGGATSTVLLLPDDTPASTTNMAATAVPLKTGGRRRSSSSGTPVAALEPLVSSPDDDRARSAAAQAVAGASAGTATAATNCARPGRSPTDVSPTSPNAPVPTPSPPRHSQSGGADAPSRSRRERARLRPPRLERRAEIPRHTQPSPFRAFLSVSARLKTQTGLRRNSPLHLSASTNSSPAVSPPPPARRSPMASPQAGRTPLLKRASVGLGALYKACHAEFAFDSSHIQRRFLTEPSQGVSNGGCDNVHGDYVLRVHDELGDSTEHCYTILGLLGRGTFGQVTKCRHKASGKLVAVKVVKNRPEFHRQSLSEIAVLTRLTEAHGRPQQRVVTMLGHFVFRGHLCLVFELLSVSLYDLLKQNKFRGLSMGRVRLFCYQLLDALSAMYDADVMHCDLKPENVLMESSGKTSQPSSGFIKVIDFGSACIDTGGAGNLHTYIQSRFYRAPEVLVGAPYTKAIDMWSFGCMAAELCLGLPIFPGTSQLDQLTQVTKLLGPLPDHLLKAGSKTHELYDGPVATAPSSSSSSSAASSPASSPTTTTTTTTTTSSYKLKTMAQYQLENGGKVDAPGADAERRFRITQLADVAKVALRWDPSATDDARAFVHFLEGILQLDPACRWTPKQAIRHPFITREPFSRSWSPTTAGNSSSGPTPPLSPSSLQRRMPPHQPSQESLRPPMPHHAGFRRTTSEPQVWQQGPSSPIPRSRLSLSGSTGRAAPPVLDHSASSDALGVRTYSGPRRGEYVRSRANSLDVRLRPSKDTRGSPERPASLIETTNDWDPNFTDLSDGDRPPSEGRSTAYSPLCAMPYSPASSPYSPYMRAAVFCGDPRDFAVDGSQSPAVVPRFAAPLPYPLIGTPTMMASNSPMHSPRYGTPCYSPADPAFATASPVMVSGMYTMPGGHSMYHMQSPMHSPMQPHASMQAAAAAAAVYPQHVMAPPPQMPAMGYPVMSPAGSLTHMMMPPPHPHPHPHMPPPAHQPPTDLPRPPPPSSSSDPS